MKTIRKNPIRKSGNRKRKEKRELFLIERKNGLFPEMSVWLDRHSYRIYVNRGKIAEQQNFLENYLYEEGSEKIAKQISIM